MATRGDIVSEIYNQLWEPSNSSNYDALTVVVPKLNQIVSRICKKIIINPQNQQRYTAGDLPFLRGTEFYENVQRRNITDEIELGDLSVSIDTTDLDTSGALMVSQDIITYTNKTATTVTGVTGIDIAQDSWTIAHRLFALPTGITKPFTMFRFDSKGGKYEIDYVDYRYPTQARKYYTMVVDTDGTEYLMFVGCSSNDKFVLNYYINSSDMSLDSSVCIIPDPYALTVLPWLVAGWLLWEREETEDAVTKLSSGFAGLDEMFAYYNSLNEKNRTTIQSTPPNLSSINGWYGKRRRYSIG